jgi:hypothetical protein
MSIDSARFKEETATLAVIAGRRPRTRVAIGVLAALVYFAILAFAGVFISGAVNSMGDRAAVARAVVQQIADAKNDSTGAAQSPPLADPQPDSSRAAGDPVPPQAAPSPPQQTGPESPRTAATAAAANAVVPTQGTVAPAMTVAPPRAAVAPATAKQSPPTIVAALTPATELPAAAPAVPIAPAPNPRAAPTSAAPKAVPPKADAAEVRTLVQAGDARLISGDIASARLYYERAAEAGNARAARLLANSYDPAFLVRWGVLGMTGNVQEAARWYRRASGLGDSEAARDLTSLQKQ